MPFVPVDDDPFASPQGQVSGSFVPVEHDPFAGSGSGPDYGDIAKSAGTGLAKGSLEPPY
jgi:hypothetical protein